jgi:hypothetical protein
VPIRPRIAAVVVIAVVATTATPVVQLSERPLMDATSHPAIEYFTRPTLDPVGELNRRIEDGSVHVAFDESSGYLKSMLDAMHVPVESQMLVMSKTGVQALHTSPDNPRAIFFNDEVTVGFIRGAPLLELAVQDPEQGVQFYTVDQKPQPRPVIERRKGCLTCHQAYSTLHVPGMVARSVFVAPDGLPLSQFGSYDPDDRTPFRQRWGGWYVTGTHGSMRHMGNAIVGNVQQRDAMISSTTLNRTSLDGLFDARGYLSAHSDIVALMVFHHQTHMMNLITRVGWQARVAAHEHRFDLRDGALRDAVNELVDYLLFVDEQPLTDSVTGTSGFARVFAVQGPTDHRGRSLRQLDLRRRLMRYPCSYMVYSPAFRALPAEVKSAVYLRMADVLLAPDPGSKYDRLSAADRIAVVEILRDTLTDLPDGWPGGRSTPQG